jgi:hypothetical protein
MTSCERFRDSRQKIRPGFLSTSRRGIDGSEAGKDRYAAGFANPPCFGTKWDLRSPFLFSRQARSKKRCHLPNEPDLCKLVHRFLR